MKKLCNNCKREFESIQGRATCSKECQTEFARVRCKLSARRFRKGIKKIEKCVVCGAEYIKLANKVCCSLECAGVRQSERTKYWLEQTKRKNAEHPKRYERKCIVCNKGFVAPSIGHICCSKECTIKRNKETRAASNIKRKALKRNPTLESGDSIHRMEIFKRDRWTCGICGKKINNKLKHPHPMSKSIDHIVPVTKGGVHKAHNLQASHLTCNLQKNNTRGGQQLLPGIGLLK